MRGELEGTRREELSDQKSQASKLATKDKFKDGRFIGPNYSSPC